MQGILFPLSFHLFLTRFHPEEQLAEVSVKWEKHLPPVGEMAFGLGGAVHWKQGIEAFAASACPTISPFLQAS
jgi:hypothetical protein